jgi:hypothetical protein
VHRHVLRCCFCKHLIPSQGNCTNAILQVDPGFRSDFWYTLHQTIDLTDEGRLHVYSYAPHDVDDDLFPEGSLNYFFVNDRLKKLVFLQVRVQPKLQVGVVITRHFGPVDHYLRMLSNTHSSFHFSLDSLFYSFLPSSPFQSPFVSAARGNLEYVESIYGGVGSSIGGGLDDEYDDDDEDIGDGGDGGGGGGRGGVSMYADIDSDDADGVGGGDGGDGDNGGGGRRHGSHYDTNMYNSGYDDDDGAYERNIVADRIQMTQMHLHR